MTSMNSLSEFNDMCSEGAIEVMKNVARKYGQQVKILRHPPAMQLLGHLYQFPHWRAAKAPVPMYTTWVDDPHGSVSSSLKLIFLFTSDVAALLQIMALLVTTMVDVLDFLCAPSVGSLYKEDMTVDELDLAASEMFEDYLNCRDQGTVQPHRLTVESHAKLEAFFMEELEPHIQHMGSTFRADASKESLDQFVMQSQDRPSNYKCPLSDGARKWATQTNKYWLKVVKHFQWTLSEAKRQRLPRQEIWVLENRILKAEHLG